MSDQLIKELNQATKAALRGLGVNWLNLRHNDAAKQIDWRAPPLVCEGLLYGLDLKQLTKVKLSASLDDFLIVYGLYIADRETDERENYTSLVRMLKITNDVKKHFPKDDEKEPYNLVPTLAALAYYNYGGTIDLIGYDSLVVSVGRYKFGMVNGGILNTEGQVITQGRRIGQKPHVIYGRRKRLEQTKLSNLFSIILEELEVDASKQKELDDLKLAMSILIQADSPAVKETWLLGLTGATAYPEVVDSLLDGASDFPSYYDPIKFLKEQLYPQVVTSGRFQKFFGARKFKGPEDLPNIAYQLGELKNTIKKEREELCL